MSKGHLKNHFETHS